MKSFLFFGMKRQKPPERKEKMPSTKTIEDFLIGTRVVFDLDGITVHGTVESAQLQKKLVDVKIYEPGHRSHCLIVSRAPETLFDAADDEGPSSYADLQRRVEGDSKVQSTISNIASAMDRLLERVETLEKDKGVLGAQVAELHSKLESFGAALAETQQKVSVLEAAALKSQSA